MNDLEKLRAEIDSIDRELLYVFSKRIKIIKKIAEYKKKNNLATLDAARWKSVLTTKKILARRLGLSSDFIEKIYTVIHDHSIFIENKK